MSATDKLEWSFEEGKMVESRYFQDEILFLKDEVADLQYTNDELTDENEDLQDISDTAVRKYKALKGSVHTRVMHENQKLVYRIMSLTDLVEEYARVLDVYAGHSHVKLSTTKLNELRQKGGYGPI